MSIEQQELTSQQIHSLRWAETERMIIEEIYDDPSGFFEWAEKLVNRLRDIDSCFDGNQIALSACDRINREKEIDTKKVFEGLIGFGKSLGFKSEVNTSSLRYTTSVVLSMYLGDKGLTVR